MPRKCSAFVRTLLRLRASEHPRHGLALAGVRPWWPRPFLRESAYIWWAREELIRALV